MAFINFKPSSFFQTKIYDGNSSTQAITGVGFQPDKLDIKRRNGGDNNWRVCDSVRTADNSLMYNLNNEASDLTGTVTAFDADGFSLGNNASYVGGFNETGGEYASYNWKMGTTSGITQGAASVTPTAYSFNATAKQSIIQWTGTGSVLTVPHGLGVEPGSIFVKCTSHSGDWVAYHKSMGGSYGMELPSTSGQSATSGWFNNTGATSDLFTIGDNGNVNTSGRTYIAYVYGPRKGMSSFGKYIGNGASTGTEHGGPFIYCNFRPCMLFIKRIDTTGAWYLWDDKREGYNETNDEFSLNSAAAEGSGNISLDILGTGFKLRNSDGSYNADGGSYIYWAWAAEPQVGSDGTPGLAR